jgi:formate hydrogenlyase transcriptional activator
MPFSEDNTLRVQSKDMLLNSDELSRLMLDSALSFLQSFGGAHSRIRPPPELLGIKMHVLEHHTRKDRTPYSIEE